MLQSILSLRYEQTHVAIVLCAVLFLITIYIFLTVGHRPKGCPPGPATLPVIGNLHQLPKKDLHEAYRKWGEKYGPIFSLQLGQETVIVLTSGSVIKRLVDKRSGNYSDRPPLYMQDLWEHSRIIMRGYDNLWKTERKLYHLFLNSSIAAKYVPYQSVETKKLLYDLLENPNSFDSHIARTTASLSASMTYGFRIHSPDSPELQRLLRTAHGFFKLVHEHKMFDYYPILKKIAKILPDALNPVAQKAREVYSDEKSFYMDLYKRTVAQADTVKLPCFAADIRHAQETWKDNSLLTDKAASYIAGISFEGGTDTTNNTLMGFMKAMALYPEAQELAQKELDEVVGSNRLPDMEDFDNLPYIRAVSKESLRWMPTAISGAIPHAAREEDEFEGHRIPKGASIVLAVWSCNNDPDLFDDPRNFNPARHLDHIGMGIGEDAVASDYRKRTSWTFGAGRRLCPGIHVAERSLFLAISRVLWAFKIERARDEDGNLIPIDRDAVTQSIAAAPMPFKCVIRPRTPEKAEIIRREWQEASNLLGDNYNYKQSII